MTLLEIAVQYGPGGRLQGKTRLDELLSELSSSPSFQTLPLDFDVAAEVAAIGGSLRDPADRAIVATARVHRLKLITSDQRIIDSGLVPVIR
jgi:PIN domain nuclease of toxin-antitoxin system